MKEQNILQQLIQNYDESRFGSQEKILFLKELWYLIKWWVGILEALETIKANTDNYALKKIVQEMIDDTRSGKSLSYSFMKNTKYFDNGDVSILRAWEKSWKLWQMLESLAKEYWFLNNMRNKYVWALIYPAILIFISIIAVFSLFTFVLPGIFDILDQFQNVQIPPITLFLQNVSDFFVSNRLNVIIWMWIFMMIVIIFGSTNMGQMFFYKYIVLNIPVISNIFISFYLVKFARYSKIMLESGMNYVETFKLLINIIDNIMYENMFLETLSGLEKWSDIYSWLVLYPDIIPPTVSALIKVWEKTSNLTNSFGSVVEIYEEELNSKIWNLSKVIEPVMLVLVWWIVILIASGIFGIITNIMDSIWT